MVARGSVVGWDTIVQTGRSRDRVLMRWIFPEGGEEKDNEEDEKDNKEDEKEKKKGVEQNFHFVCYAEHPKLMNTSAESTYKLKML
jgi:hypothetical protein